MAKGLETRIGAKVHLMSFVQHRLKSNRSGIIPPADTLLLLENKIH